MRALEHSTVHLGIVAMSRDWRCPETGDVPRLAMSRDWRCPEID